MNEPQRTGRRIEIVHESLLTKWPRLVHWQTQDAEGAQLRDELRQAAQVWEQHGRLPDFLWTGTAFRDYQVWRERYPGGLSAVETDFTQAMEVGARRRRRRRRTALATLFAGAAVVAVVTSALWQRAEASRQRAEASKLGVLGERELETYPTGALAYAIKSLEVADTEAGRLLALRVLQQGPVARIAEVGLGEADGGFALNLDFSPSGEWVATGGFTKSEVLNQDGRRRLLLGEYGTAGQGAFAVRFAPRSDALIASQKGDVRVWSIPEGRELRHERIDHGAWNALVTGDDDFVTINEVEGRMVFRSWPLGPGEPRLLGTVDRFGTSDWDATRETLAFGRGARLLLQSLEQLDSPPRSIDENHGALAAELSIELPANIRAMTLSADSRRVAAKEPSGEIRIWDTASHSDAPIRILEGDEGLRGLWFGRQSRWLAETGHEDGLPTIRLWDLEAPRGATPIELRRGGDRHYMFGVAFDAQGRWLATGHANDLALWWLGRDYPRVFRVQGTIHALVFTPDGRSLISSSNDGAVRVWPVVSGSAEEPRVLLRADISIDPGIAIDPRGRNVAVTGAKGRIYVVPLDGSPATQLEGFSDRVELTAVAFGGDGRLVAATPFLGPAEEKVIRIFDLESGTVRVLGPVPGVSEGYGGIDLLRFEGLDRVLAHVYRQQGPGDAPVIVSFDLRTGEASTVSAPWPRDSEHRLVATASAGIIRVGPESGSEPHLLLGHTGRVWSAILSPDGRWLASGGADRTIRLWRVPDVSKPPLHTLPLDTLLAKLRTHTNVRAVPDPASSAGYKLEIGPFPGWATPPEW